MIRESIRVPIDVSCTECSCYREGVPGVLLEGGGYGAPEDEEQCSSCGHPSSSHRFERETKSDLEKLQDA